MPNEIQPDCRLFCELHRETAFFDVFAPHQSHLIQVVYTTIRGYVNEMAGATGKEFAKFEISRDASRAKSKLTPVAVI
jgi:hypothetical protein